MATPIAKMKTKTLLATTKPAKHSGFADLPWMSASCIADVGQSGFECNPQIWSADEDGFSASMVTLDGSSTITLNASGLFLISFHCTIQGTNITAPGTVEFDFGRFVDRDVAVGESTIATPGGSFVATGSVDTFTSQIIPSVTTTATMSGGFYVIDADFLYISSNSKVASGED